MVRGVIKVAATLGSFAIVFPALDVVAADLGSQRRAYPIVEQQIPASIRQFYLRGDVGWAFHEHGDFSQADLDFNGGSFIAQSIGSSVTVGGGIGVQLDRRFRVDLTGEYRTPAKIRATDNVSGFLSDPDGSLQANTEYEARLSAFVGMLNGYWDIGTWNGFTPYVGAGVGFARVKISDVTTQSQATFTDAFTGDQLVQNTSGSSASNTRTNLAWSLMAGLSYDMRSNMKLDLGYRYLNLGSGETAQSSLLVCECGTIGEPLKFADIEAHEMRVGVRMLLNNDRPTYQPLK